jgi:DNA-binding transcriptional LysR family regulator
MAHLDLLRRAADRARGVLEQGLALRGVHQAEQRARLRIIVRVDTVVPVIGRAIAPFLLLRCLPALHRRYPRLQVALREDVTADLLARLADGQLDFALHACGTAPRRTRARVEATSLLTLVQMIESGLGIGLVTRRSTARLADLKARVQILRSAGD